MSWDYTEILKERKSISALINLLEQGEITQSSGDPAHWAVQVRYHALAVHAYVWTGDEWLPADRIRATTLVVNAAREAFEVFIGADADYERVARNQLGPVSGEAVAGMNGFFANPITLGQRCPICGRVHLETRGGRAEMIACFRRGLLDSPYWVTPNLETFRHLRHRILGCPCKPGPCHGDVYQELLDATGPAVPVWLR